MRHPMTWLGGTLLTLGTAIGLIIGTRVHTGMPHSAAVTFWVGVAATLTICGTITLTSDRLAQRITSSAWQRLAHDLRDHATTTTNTGRLHPINGQTTRGRTPANL